MSNKFSTPTKGVPLQFSYNGQTLTIEWTYYPPEPNTGTNETVEIAGVYDLHNDEVAYSQELYSAALKALFATRR